MIVVGEDETKQPATLGYTNDYKSSVGYGDEVTVVCDPGWEAVQGGISHASSISFPFFSVLDGQMRLLYAGSDEVAVQGLVLSGGE